MNDFQCSWRQDSKSNPKDNTNNLKVFLLNSRIPIFETWSDKICILKKSSKTKNLNNRIFIEATQYNFLNI